ncbi:LytTR family transcriptional regulator [Pedobacter sp. PAMC26386]|nr:LytTR family transcriptional regulator [Pedobacter sp. PAMC26386]
MSVIASFRVNSMFKMALESRFSLLDTPRDKNIFILIIFVFSLLFMDTFIPFNINKWYDLSQLSLFEIICVFSFFGALTLVFTQYGLRKWLHLKMLNCIQYILWVIGEIMILTIVMLAIDWLLNKHPDLTLDYYLVTFKYTLLIAIIPYIVSLLVLFALQKHQLARFLSKMKDAKPLSYNLPIEDEKGKVVLTLHPDHLLFFKSEDNYVDVYYLMGGKVRKELIRTTLKKIEEKCHYSGLIRVHRSYTINVKHISSSRKTAKGYLVQFDLLPDLQIPVSASYQKQFAAFPFTP